MQKGVTIGLFPLGGDNQVKEPLGFFVDERDAHESAENEELDRYLLIPVYGHYEKLASAKRAAGKKPAKQIEPGQ